MRIDSRTERAGAGLRRRPGLPGPHVEPGEWHLPESPQPLFPRRPWSTVCYSIVALVAVLPGLHGLRFWDLIPPGPWWGLRGLAVLEGHWLDQVPLSGLGPEGELRAYRHVAMQPPLYGWLEAAALLVTGDREPIATVIPSYIAGVLVVLLVYLHGKLWGGPRLGAMAAVLTGFNRHLLSQMQQASPTTLGLATALAALYFYARAVRKRSRASCLAACALGGLALGLSLLSVSLLALSLVGVAALHQALIGVEPGPRHPRRTFLPSRALVERALIALAVTAALALGLAVALPWHVTMFGRYSHVFIDSLLSPPMSPIPLPSEFPGRLVLLAPTVLLLALYEAARAARAAWRSAPGDPEPSRVGGAFWVAWAVVAAGVPSLFPAGTRPAFALFLLVPMNLLAARCLLALADREIPARKLLWLAPGTIMVLAWAGSPEIRASLLTLVRGVRISPANTRMLGLVAVGLIAVFTLVARLDRWARRDDWRRRLSLGVFLAAVVGLTAVGGLREVQFRHRETLDLLRVRDSIVRRHDQRKFTVLAVLGPDIDHHADSPDAPPAEPPRPLPPASPRKTGAQRLASIGPQRLAATPGGRLRFVLRSALPHLAQIDLARVDDLANLPDGQRLVVLAGAQMRLSYALQARLRLESLDPGGSGLVDAYATPIDPPKARKFRR